MMNPEIQVTTPSEASAGIPLPRVRDPFTMTIFGATGDLTHRKLVPALYAMFVKGLLPEAFAIIGFARRDYDDATFRDWMAESIREFSRVSIDAEPLRDFCGHLYYLRSDLNEAAGYQALQERVTGDDAFPANHLFYLSVAPRFFEVIVGALSDAGLIRSPFDPEWTRVVIEKPFGRDLASAKSLNASVRSRLDETQIFRIDHYLGKETVQNILSFRFANAIFEPLFNHKYVEHVEITASETVGMEKGRGAYFDATGCLRDMVQNHMLQLLCLVAMEPPANMTAEAVRNEKVKVLQSVLPIRPEAVPDVVVRGQYIAGDINGRAVPGYRDEDRVDPASSTESYVALRLTLANWRWANVPFFLRTGKRMQKRATEIRVRFKVPPLELFQTVACVGDVCDLTQTSPNILVFRIQPDEGISLQFSAKRPAMQVQVENVAMDFDYSSVWPKSLPEAYERLLLDVMRGDSTLFTRSDEVEAAWQIVEPILRRWREDPDVPIASYRAGTWGPEEANNLFEGIGGWATCRG